MQPSASRENILKKIRKALTETTPLPFPASEGTTSVFVPGRQELEIEFGEQFTKLLGKFIYCADETELHEQLTTVIAHNNWDKIYFKEDELKGLLSDSFLKNIFYSDLATANAAITGCEALVARTGSIILSSAQLSGRTTSVYAETHICIAYTDQLVYDVRDGLQLIKDKYNKIPSLVTFATGPSRTADIEKTLVVGVHGPREVYVFLVESQNK
ncbi:MAG: LUD domain-containing protein [Chitinophagaceae bacterium]|nr:LUD domain-containing protein [Chitinophagaceae bacterium]